MDVAESSNLAQESNQASAKTYISNPFEVFFGTFQHATYNIGHFFALFGLGAGGGLLIGILIVLGVFLMETIDPLAGLPVFVLAALIGMYYFSVIGYANTRYILSTSLRQIISFKQLFHNSFQRSLGFLALNLLVGLAVLGGLLLLIAPGIIFYIWFRFAKFIYVDEELGIMESLSRSKALAKGKGPELISLSLVGSIADGIVSGPSNLFAPLILITLPFVVAVSWMKEMSMAYRYQSAKYLEANNLVKPPTHWTNWLMIGLYAGLIVMILLVFLAMAIAASWQQLR